MASRFAVATLAGMMTLAVVGSLLYGVLFADLFAANSGSTDGEMDRSPTS